MSTDEIPRPAAGPPAAESGSTWIADQIVAKIAAAAAREVDGVEDLRGGGIRRGWVRGVRPRPWRGRRRPHRGWQGVDRPAPGRAGRRGDPGRR